MSGLAAEIEAILRKRLADGMPVEQVPVGFVPLATADILDAVARMDGPEFCAVCLTNPVEPGQHVCANNRCQSEGATR